VSKLEENNLCRVEYRPEDFVLIDPMSDQALAPNGTRTNEAANDHSEAIPASQ
jgi:hypothetical protein